MSGLKIEAVELSALGSSNNLLQSGFWGMLKAEFGWKPFAFRFSYPELCTDQPLLVLVRELGAGQSLAYVPHGPMLPDSAEGCLDRYWNAAASVAEALKNQLPASCMFIRFDPPWGLSSPALSGEQNGYPEKALSPSVSSEKSSAGGSVPSSRFKKSMMDIQPPSTVLLDLSGKTEEDILSGMKSKTRYNIRLAAKKGVEVRFAGAEALENWYELYRVTAERDRIALHESAYYERIFSLAAERQAAEDGGAPELHLLEAVIDGVVEAGIIVSYQGQPGKDRRATYMYGASSNNNRNLMPTYLLQWEAVRAALSAGCLSYDFFGIPPADDPDHPMHGLYRFKTGFGGMILHRPGCWDYPYKKTAYTAFSGLEKGRNFYYKKFRKRK